MQTTPISFVARGKDISFHSYFFCVHIITKSQLELKMQGDNAYRIYFHFKLSASSAKGNCKTDWNLNPFP